MRADARGRILRNLLPLLLVVPVAAGLAGVLLPAFGHLPALGRAGPTLAVFVELFGQPGLAASLLLALLPALLVPALALLLVLLALAAGAGWERGGRRGLLAPLLAVPHAATAFALAFLIAPSGFFARLVSPELTGWQQPPDVLVPNDPLGLSLMAGLLLKEVPFLFLVALAVLPACRPAEALRVGAALGHGPVHSFLVGAAPLLYRRIRLPVLAVVVYSASAVDMALILGPELPATLAVRVLRWMNDAELALRFRASAAAMLQLGVTVLALLLWWLGERLAAALLARRLARGGALLPEWAGPVAGWACALLFATVWLGLAVLLLWAVAGVWRFPDAWPASLTWDTLARAMAAAGEPLLRTLLLGLAAAGLALVAVVLHLVAEGRPAGGRGLALRDGWLLLPLLVPEVAFLFGLQVWLLLLGARPDFASVLLGHLLLVTPYVYLALAPPWRALDRRHEAVAAALGASPLRCLLAVRLPLLAAPLLTAFAIGFSVSVALYLPTLVLGAGRVPTITTETVALAAGSDRRLTGALALLQAGLPLAVFLLALLLPRLLFRHRRGMRGFA